jgi:hypothetical protein
MTDISNLTNDEAHDAIQRALEQYAGVLKKMGAGIMPKASEVAPAMDMLRAELERLRSLVVSHKESQDEAYRERNNLVVVLAKLYPASIELDLAEADPEWKYVVIVDFPTGQASWHIHKDEINLFSFLPLNAGRVWDGHTTEEKYRRIAELKPKE